MNYSLVCPFLTDDPIYAFGVELGMLFSEMEEKTEIKNYFCLENQEQILLLANRLGWTVREMKIHDEYWFWLEMYK